MGKKSLKMQCPQCRRYDNSECVKSDPGHYRWSDETTPLFERIAGQDLSFRQRTRQCSNCGAEFPVVEMSKHYLAAMIEEIQRLTKEILRLTGEVNQLTLSQQNSQQKAETTEAKNKTLEAENQLLLEKNRIMKAKLKAIDDIAKTEVSDGESCDKFTGSQLPIIELRNLGLNKSSNSVNHLSESSN